MSHPLFRNALIAAAAAFIAPHNVDGFRLGADRDESGRDSTGSLRTRAHRLGFDGSNRGGGDFQRVLPGHRPRTMGQVGSGDGRNRCRIRRADADHRYCLGQAGVGCLVDRRGETHHRAHPLLRLRRLPHVPGLLSAGNTAEKACRCHRLDRRHRRADNLLGIEPLGRSPPASDRRAGRETPIRRSPQISG